MTCDSCKTCFSYSAKLNMCLQDKANPSTARETYKAVKQGIRVCPTNDWIRDLMRGTNLAERQTNCQTNISETCLAS